MIYIFFGLIRVYVINIDPNLASATLTNEPTGMVVGSLDVDSVGIYYPITWTPGALDENIIYGQEPYPITLTISVGKMSKGIIFLEIAQIT